MSRSAKPAIAGVLLVLLLGLAACGGSDDDGSTSVASTASPGATDTAAQGREMHDLKVALVPGSGTMAIALGAQKGIFEKHGVRLEFVAPAATSAGQVPQLLNGQANVGLGALTTILAAAAKNVPVRAVAAYGHDFDRDGQTNYAFIVPKDSHIQRYRDLEGKTVGVNSLQSQWDASIRESVAKDGGDPDKVKFVSIPFPDQATALRQGRVDGVMTLQPFVTSFLQQGDRSIGDPQAFALGDPQNVTGVAFMAKEFIDKNPETVKAFVEGLREASDYATSHPDELQKITSEKTGLPAKLVESTPVPSYDNAIPPANVERWNELLVKYGILDEPVPVDQVLWTGAPTS